MGFDHQTFGLSLKNVIWDDKIRQIATDDQQAQAAALKNFTRNRKSQPRTWHVDKGELFVICPCPMPQAVNSK